MQVAKDTLVTISAKMYNLQGDLMESADDLVYLHGHSDIFPVIEKALEGKKPGDTVTVQLEPEEAFGDYDETALIIRPETDFDGGVEVGLSYTEIRGETLDRVYVLGCPYGTRGPSLRRLYHHLRRLCGAGSTAL